MKLLNKLNLPEPLVNAVLNQEYSKGSSDITVTQLIQPPYIRKLTQDHWDELEEDVSSRIWALLGSSVHGVLEKAFKGTSARVEERIYTDVLGWRVGGQFDVLEDNTLSDYKVTSVYAREGKIEWEQQLNILRYLLHKNNTVVNKLQIVAIFRDWNKYGLMKEYDYPESQVAIIPVKLWDMDATEQFVIERVKAHQDPNPSICTAEERWATQEKWALMKDGGKRATKLFEIKPETVEKGYYIEHRPAVNKRCNDYCSVNKFCSYFNNTTF